MKIAPELIALAREHHQSLVLASRAIRLAKSGDELAIKDLCLTIHQTFKDNFSEHFSTEEETVFKPMMLEDEQFTDMCECLMAEHIALFQLADDLLREPDNLLAFGELLKKHTRMEDRQLFPHFSILRRL